MGCRNCAERPNRSRFGLNPNPRWRSEVRPRSTSYSQSTKEVPEPLASINRKPWCFISWTVSALRKISTEIDTGSDQVLPLELDEKKEITAPHIGWKMGLRRQWDWSEVKKSCHASPHADAWVYSSCFLGRMSFTRSASDHRTSGTVQSWHYASPSEGSDTTRSLLFYDPRRTYNKPII